MPLLCVFVPSFYLCIYLFYLCMYSFICKFPQKHLVAPSLTTPPHHTCLLVPLRRREVQRCAAARGLRFRIRGGLKQLRHQRARAAGGAAVQRGPRLFVLKGETENTRHHKAKDHPT